MRDAVEHTEADNRDDAMQMAIMLKHLYDIPALTVALVEGGGVRRRGRAGGGLRHGHRHGGARGSPSPRSSSA